MATTPSVAIIGPGAIGCAIAGALIEAGHNPLLAARTPFCDLQVSFPSGMVQAPAQVITDTASCPPADFVFVAVKAHQTLEAGAWFDRLVDSKTTVFICQNGVEHIDRLAPLVVADATLVPVVVDLPVVRVRPGVVKISRHGVLTAPHDVGIPLRDLLSNSPIHVELSEDWLTQAWTKLMSNACVGGICALTRSDDSVFSDDTVATFAANVLQEIAVVGRAAGAKLPEGLPSQILSHLRSTPSYTTSSIARDRLAGLPTEWDARNAVVGRIARRQRIATPNNDLLTTLLRAGEDGTVSRSSEVCTVDPLTD